MVWIEHLNVYYSPGNRSITFACETIVNRTLGPVYSEFGCNKHPLTTRRFLCINISYNKHPLTTRRFLCINITDSNIKKFGYEHSPTTSCFLCIYLLVLSGTLKEKFHFNSECVQKTVSYNTVLCPSCHGCCVAMVLRCHGCCKIRHVRTFGSKL